MEAPARGFPSGDNADDRRTRDVLVVGGGISGLTAAWCLRRAGVDAEVLERDEHVGGSVRTERRAGFLLEKGPFNVMVRAPEFEELLTCLGGRVKVVTAAKEANNRYIYRHGGLRKVPMGPVSLFTTGLLSTGAGLRALRGLLISARGREAEPTLEQFATRRFGREVADTLVSAAISGILAGDIGQLSAYAAFPALEEFDRHSLSPLGRTLRRLPLMLRGKSDAKKSRRWKGLVSLDRGLGGLCEALVADIGPERVHTGAGVTGFSRAADGFALTVRSAERERTLRCRRLVLATPARPTAELLRPHASEAADALGLVRSASLVVINMAFRRADVGHPLEGFGFLVPRNEPKFPLMGVLWADSAFPHHAPPDQHLLRVFIGGPRAPEAAGRPIEELLRIALPALRDALGVCGEPTLVDAVAYPEAIPQYTLGHRARVAVVRAAAGRIPGLHLAGNYLDGVSINDCVKTGRRVANEVSAAVLAR